MLVPQKCQYALRAVLELCKRKGQGSVTSADIAKAQSIPARFLEVILSELKHGGVVSSRRGSAGGYTVVAEPSELSVGMVMLAMHGPVGPVECISIAPESHCPLQGDCAFMGLWERAGGRSRASRVPVRANAQRVRNSMATVPGRALTSD